MSAEDLLREGNLEAAKAALQETVRREPAVPKHRVFLFQILSLLGDWKRAMTQLEVLRDMDASTLPMVQTYGSAIQAELFREEVFAGRRAPLVLGEPEGWLAALMQALTLTAEGKVDQAEPLRARAFDEAEAFPGTIDGAPFEWIADADTRIGPVLELIANGRYFWVPFSRIAELKLEPPTDLRDFVWAPAQIVLGNGGDVAALIPTRYAGTPGSDDSLRMARRTEWRDLGGGCFAGLGQRMLATDAGEFPLLDVRHVSLEHGEAGAPPESGGSAV